MHRIAANMTNIKLNSFSFACDGLPADIAAAKTIGPFYFIDGRVSALLRLRHAVAARAHIQYPAAIRDNVIAIASGSGMKYFDAFDLRGVA